MRKCSKCEIVKPSNAFRDKKGRKDGKCSQCKDCEKEYRRKYELLNPGLLLRYGRAYEARHGARRALRARSNYLKRKYGISPEQYDEMYQDQSGKCFICKKQEKAKQFGKIMLLSVDHCHKTNKIRKLLCCKCNKVLGYVDDDVEILKSMIKYLNRNF